MKQSKVFAKDLLRPALAVLVMAALAACGAGPGAASSGTANGGLPSSEPGANSQSSVQLPVTTVPTDSAIIGPTIESGGQSTGDARPEGAVAGIKVEPEGRAKTQRAAEPAGGEKTPNLDLSDRKEVRVDFGQYRQLLPQDAILPIYEPRFVTAEKAGLDPGELVIGVELNGESKAYPIGPLVRREMVNDTVGGVPILVTW